MVMGFKPWTSRFGVLQSTTRLLIKFFVFRLNKTVMSWVMRKPDFCLCENKGADQLWCKCTDRTFPPKLIPKNFKILGFFYGCIGRLV